MLRLLSVAIVVGLVFEDSLKAVDAKEEFIPLPICWTKWYDRDNPSGSGDWEHLKALRMENNGEICKFPKYIEAVTTDTMTPAMNTGQKFYAYSPTQGLICLNKDQKNGNCYDYKVRFGCPCNGEA